MTNTGTPTPGVTPPSGGGMPKWVIILLVVLLVILLGCCGGFAACHFMCTRVAQTVQQAAPAMGAFAQERTKAAESRLRESEAQMKRIDEQEEAANKVTVEAEQELKQMQEQARQDEAKLQRMVEKAGQAEEANKIIADGGGGVQTAVGGNGRAAARLHETMEEVNKASAETKVQLREAEAQLQKVSGQVEEVNKTTADGGGPVEPTAGGNGAAGAGQADRGFASGLGTGKVPANFPSDVPVMKGLTSTSLSTADKLNGSGMATFTGKINHDDVAAYFDKELPRQGWKEETNQDIGAQTAMSFTKDKRKVTVIITPDADKTSSVVMITYETQQP